MLPPRDALSENTATMLWNAQATCRPQAIHRLVQSTHLAESSLLAIPGQMLDMGVKKPSVSYSSHPSCLVFQTSSRDPRYHGVGTTQPLCLVQTPDTKPNGPNNGCFYVTSFKEAYFAALFSITEILYTAGLLVAGLL